MKCSFLKRVHISKDKIHSCLGSEETLWRTSVFKRNTPVQHDDKMRLPGEEVEIGCIVEEVATTKQDSGEVEVSNNFFLPFFYGVVVREENLVKLFNLASYFWFI